MQQDNPVTAQQCPECENQIEAHKGFIKWCPACNWNLDPQIPEPKNIIEATYAKLGTRQSKRLFEEMLQPGALKPKLTVYKLLSYVLATTIHLFSIGMLAFGIWLVIIYWLNLGIALGIFCILLAIATRPRFEKWPEKVYTREELPATFRLVDKIGAVLNAPKVHGIQIDWDFNASYQQTGIQGKRLLALGLPLFYYLNEQERIALIGHELAHGINGDAGRGQYVGTAINTLAEWYILLMPAVLWEPTDLIQGIAMFFANLVRYGLAQIVRWFAALLAHLLWQDSQRAEYLADAIAAEAGSSQAKIALLEKLYFGKSYYVAAGRYILNPQLRKEMSLFDYTKSWLDAVPKTEIERIRRMQELTMTRLNITHPPTSFRRQLIEATSFSEPKVNASAIDFEPIMEELAGIEASVQTDMFDNRNLVL